MITKEKGDLAISNAIRHFMMADYEVCLPIGDKRAYDLVTEKANNLEKVQVKYAGIYADGKCKVGLRTTGGINRSILPRNTMTRHLMCCTCTLREVNRMLYRGATWSLGTS